MIIKFTQKDLKDKKNEIDLYKLNVTWNGMFVATEVEVYEELNSVRIYGHRKGYYKSSNGESFIDLNISEGDIRRIIDQQINLAGQVLELPVADSCLVEILPCTILETSLLIPIGKSTPQRVTNDFLQCVQDLLNLNIGDILEEIPEIEDITLCEVSEVMVVPSGFLTGNLKKIKSSNNLFSRIIQIDLNFLLPPYENFRLIMETDKVSKVIEMKISRYISKMLEDEGLIYEDFSGRHEIAENYYK